MPGSGALTSRHVQVSIVCVIALISSFIVHVDMVHLAPYSWKSLSRALALTFYKNLCNLSISRDLGLV